MTDKWQTEGDQIEPGSIKKMLFRNNEIDNFLNYDNKYYVIATKGIGKTLLLKMKRYKLEKKYFYSSKKENMGIIFIPKDTPYLDFPDTTHFDYLRKSHKVFLSDWINCEKLWLLSIKLSIISYHRKTNPIVYATYLEIFSWLESRKPIDPCFIFTTILKTHDMSGIHKIVREYSNDDLSEIQSGVCVFIDKIDQAMRSLNDKNIWMAVQIGLLEAAHSITAKNNHIKVYLSIRQEAYFPHHSASKAAISGSTTLIEYDYDDLKNMVDILSLFYEGKKSFYEFANNISEVVNLNTKAREDSFEYLYRHTIGRPRDIICICSDLSANGNFDEEEYKYIVNTTVRREVADNIFDEVSVLLHELNDETNREVFFELVSYNILTKEELKTICREYNNRASCEDAECKKRKECKHPFCDLYNSGLLGIINEHSEQKFMQPHDSNKYNSRTLPINSPFYFVHPALHFLVRDSRNNIGKEYKLIRKVIIKHGCKWENNLSRFVETQKVIFENTKDMQARNVLLEKLGDFGTDEDINSLRGYIKTDIGSVVDNFKNGAIGVKTIVDILEKLI